ncbi:MAG TPA: glycosyltransferase, partial [Candidatus Desulfofervidus auxilii]|nr:glycosyltransferase [Candidatus Desulfofervidus auxilii]
MEISIVIPVYNEEQALPKLYNSLKKVLESLQKKYEIILVDDGSTDRTWEVLSVLRAKDDSLKIIRFTRNFGQTAAIAAGFYHA